MIKTSNTILSATSRRSSASMTTTSRSHHGFLGLMFAQATATTTTRVFAQSQQANHHNQLQRRAMTHSTGAFVTSFASILHRKQHLVKNKNSNNYRRTITSSSSSSASFLRPRRTAATIIGGGSSSVQQTTTATAATRTSSALSMSTSALSSSNNNNNNNNEGNQVYDFDYFVIGGGSGGIASARRAATYGAKVGVAENARLGGTCVNVGCVPKKVMWNAANIAELLKHDIQYYGFSSSTPPTFDWNYLKKARDAYITRLNGIYERNLAGSNVTVLNGYAKIDGMNTITLSPSNGDPPSQYTAKHILIAVGGQPVFPNAPGVQEYTISSDGFFELDEMPERAVVVGAGYIAVELAGVLQSLGCQTSLVVRYEKALRNFDPLISDTLDSEMTKQGIKIYRNTNGLEKIELNEEDGTKIVHLKNGEKIDNIDTVLVAPGRKPNVSKLNLQSVGIETKPNSGYIVTNEYSETNVPNIYALGDVCGIVELTPTAIAAGRRLADRLFGGYTNAKISYDLVPTVVFSHPPIGTIGLTESQAIEKYGAENIKIYQSKFVNLYYGPMTINPDDKPRTAMKLICAGSNEMVVGLHVIGMGADEMLQGFGIALKMGATKADFDSCIAIHPTAAEEFVTMFPWGLSPHASGAKHSPLNGSSPPQPEITEK